MELFKNMPGNNSVTDNVEFDEPSHKYKYKGHEFETSVTSFVHKHFPPFIEADVIRNILGSKKMKDPSYDYYGMNREQILKKWDESRDLGTLLHAQIEYFYDNNRTSDGHIDTIEYHYFLNFDRDFPYIKPFKTEMRLYSMDLDLAGSIDLLIQNPDGTFVIMDHKRTRSIDTSTEVTRFTKYALLPGISHIMNTNLQHYSFQLNCYRYILQREYGYVISGMFLAVFHPNNKSKNYEIHSIPFMDVEMEYIMNIRLNDVKNRNK